MNRPKVLSVLFPLLFAFGGLRPETARSDFFGGDLPLLAQLVVNSAQQLTQLASIIRTGNQNLELIQQINRGIHDSMYLIQTTFPGADPGIYKNWENASSALRELQKLYGVVPDSRHATLQKNTDQSVVEAISLNNSIYTYTKRVDELGESIKSMSHRVSPGGAQKLTAESLGVMITILNQSLRTQATGLKLQAESLALQNHHDKESAREGAESAKVLRGAMQSQSTKFELPRF